MIGPERDQMTTSVDEHSSGGTQIQNRRMICHCWNEGGDHDIAEAERVKEYRWAIFKF